MSMINRNTNNFVMTIAYNVEYARPEVITQKYNPMFNQVLLTTSVNDYQYQAKGQTNCQQLTGKEKKFFFESATNSIIEKIDHLSKGILLHDNPIQIDYSQQQHKIAVVVTLQELENMQQNLRDNLIEYAREDRNFVYILEKDNETKILVHESKFQQTEKLSAIGFARLQTSSTLVTPNSNTNLVKLSQFDIIHSPNTKFISINNDLYNKLSNSKTDIGTKNPGLTSSQNKFREEERKLRDAKSVAAFNAKLRKKKDCSLM